MSTHWTIGLVTDREVEFSWVDRVAGERFGVHFGLAYLERVDHHLHGSYLFSFVSVKNRTGRPLNVIAEQLAYSRDVHFEYTNR